MKKILLLWTAWLCGSLFHVNAQGVAFRDLTLPQALERAKAENKLLFLDCGTPWCGACKAMEKDVLSTSEVGELLNASCVCVKLNMAAKENKKYHGIYQVQAYPTYLLVRPDGQLQHRVRGSRRKDVFLDRMRKGMEWKTSLLYLDSRYDAGRLKQKEYPLYREALEDASMQVKLQEVAGREFRELSDKEKMSPVYWKIYDRSFITPHEEAFLFLLAHKPDFDRAIGAEVVGQRIYAVYADMLRRIKTGTTEGESPDFLLGLMDRQLETVDFAGKPQIVACLNYLKAFRMKEVEPLLVVLEENVGLVTDFFKYELPFELEFVVISGSIEQVNRFLKLESQLTREFAEGPIQQVLDNTFARYRNILRDRSQLACVSGCVTRDKMTEVRLYEVVDGKEILLSTTRVGKDGLYGFSFQPSHAGFYTVGGEQALDRIRLYLKPGDRSEVDIPEDTLIITARNTPENLLLAKWEALIIPVRERVDHLDYVLFDYQEFYPYFVNFLPQAYRFKEGIDSRNENFGELLRQTVGFDLDYYAFRILNALKANRHTHRPSRPTPADYPEYYRTLVVKDKLSDASILQQPYGYDYLLRYTDFALKGEQAEATLENRLKWLPDDLLKAEIILWQAERCRNYDQYIRIVRQYADFLTTENHQKRMEAVSAKLYKGIEGKEAADFSYPDRSGKIVSLSDFRGKVVLVDVWATWCGPCRAEVPYLVKLEKEMEGTDVVFIGVSLDEKKDWQKWITVLDKEGMTGIQLFANGWSQIVKEYKIKGIPRFMVFDRNGNVVTIHAPRPSDPALKKLLEKVLKE